MTIPLVIYGIDFLIPILLKAVGLNQEMGYTHCAEPDEQPTPGGNLAFFHQPPETPPERNADQQQQHSLRIAEGGERRAFIAHKKRHMHQVYGEADLADKADILVIQDAGNNPRMTIADEHRRGTGCQQHGMRRQQTDTEHDAHYRQTAQNGRQNLIPADRQQQEEGGRGRRPAGSCGNHGHCAPRAGK